MARAAATAARRIQFALSGRLAHGFVVDGEWIVRRTGTATDRILPRAAVELTGRHMLNNVLAAVAATSVAGVTPSAMVEALRGFHGLPHVMEPAGEIAGVRFINDSKATNIEAARRAIESFDSLVVIMGGRFKGGDLADLRTPLVERAIAVVAIGEARPLIRAAFADVLPVQEAADMAAAVRAAFTSAVPGSAVVLAPACSSFDMFHDYAERGRIFKQEVLKLQKEVGGVREQ
jgi:UDP-N-acetylmuramoylalanine--D-glutamate ligase